MCSAKGARDSMVNFQLISLFLVEVTALTSPLSLFEQTHHFWRRLVMGAGYLKTLTEQGRKITMSSQNGV